MKNPWWADLQLTSISPRKLMQLPAVTLPNKMLSTFLSPRYVFVNAARGIFFFHVVE